MNVLSLFDGISCGQVALNRAGIKYDNYYASEIDKYAIKVTQHHFPNTIQLGDVTKINVSELPKIDLLIGGSPCQGFSFAGKRLNFDDPRSKLFFEYVRILNELRDRNPNVKFLLENVLMDKKSENVISENLGIRPIMINSNCVSAQNRKRLYWSNINFKEVGLWNEKITDFKTPKRCKLVIKDILSEEPKYLKQKPENVTHSGHRVIYKERKSYALKRDGTGGNKAIKIYEGTKVRILTPLEYERLQTLPDNYTSMISNSERYNSIGNGWTVDVIKIIFGYLK